METIDIVKIESLPSGEVAIYPSRFLPSFQYVSRTAAGVMWDDTQQRFYAVRNGYDAKEKGFLFWVSLIHASVKDELGINLTPTNKTKWINIMQADIEAACHALTQGV